MRGSGGRGGRIWFNKGDTTPVYERKNEEYQPRKLKKVRVKGDMIDINAVEREVHKCLQESTTRRLYQPSE